MNLLDPGKQVLAEITSTSHDHGGPGWEFSHCLWSPSVNAAGHASYSPMRLPVPGDIVLHLIDSSWEDSGKRRRFSGMSIASKECAIRDDEPPSPGIWAGMAPYLRVELSDYQELLQPLPIASFIEAYTDEILHEIVLESPKYYPFLQVCAVESSIRTFLGHTLPTRSLETG